jgi:hypothetical protein
MKLAKVLLENFSLYTIANGDKMKFNWLKLNKRKSIRFITEKLLKNTDFMLKIKRDKVGNSQSLKIISLKYNLC